MSTALTPAKRPHDRNHTETNGKSKLQKTVNSPVRGVVFRILCPASKTGGIIGKGGAIISQIRQETGAKVRVEETVPGSDERVVIIAAGSDKEMEVNNAEQNRGDSDDKEPNVGEESNGKQAGSDEDDENKETVSVEHSTKSVRETSSLQKALVLVFERMLEAEPEMDEGNEEKKKPSMSTLRLLVLSSQVGCLLGKGGSVIKQMSAESGAQIRILPRDKLPICASPTDELVQIAGEVDAIRKALQSVAQQLLENPPKDPEAYPPISTGPSSHSFGHPLPRPEAYPPPYHSFNARGTTYGAGPREFHEGGMPGRMRPAPDMLTFRLLCLDEKVGGVIGKGGAIIKTLQQETGCEIKVLEGVSDSEDRIILISGPAHPDDRISAAQDAVLRVQTRIARALPLPEGKEKAVIGRLLVSSNQIGCLLGKGGAIMAEMRKSTGAYIRILGKDQIPKCASENEEVVQINGEHEVVQEALLQITTRLRNHFFRDVFPSIDHPSNPAFLDQAPPFPPYMGRRELSPPFHAFHSFDGMGGPPPPVGFHPHDDHSPFMHNIHRPGMPPHFERKPWGPQGLMEAGGPMGLPEFGGHPQRRISGFGGVNHPAIITSTTVEVVVPRSVVPVIYGEDGACLKQIRQISDAKITVTEPKPGAAETVIIISGTPEQTHAAQSLIQAFVMSERESA
ncbi:KH domain-containing protein HEN4 [Ricinus communis]|uniref:Poly(RC)-binding protein, putative n=1 Tax=Ricinus communis TaxID=3988 RepID=B9R6S1_RICCO|nr:KH domain-containing protein HEN4 [Ricinus communis]EEF52201.1 Poly(rC)-binding protein, putative [Ricinus communis]|eukprot:XP_002510014.1 KH domain-containing protein HEN4 [Ricinus communis]